MSNLRKYYKLPRKQRTLFRETLLKMYCSKFLLLLFSFKKVASFLKNKGSEGQLNEQEVLEIKQAIFRANKLAWWKHTCLVNTLTSRWVLNRRKISSTAYLGVKKDESQQLIAHAWLKAGNYEIIPKEEDFLELHQF